MKWLIYLLLLANISFFAWHYQAVGREEQRVRAEQQSSLEGAVRLVMLNEANASASADKKTQLPQCRSLGPFDKRKQAEKVETLLQQQGIHLSLRVSNDARRKGYWVHLPPAASRDAARVKARKLKNEHRIKDIFIVATGQKKNSISLGVFSKFELAYRRQSEIRKLGFNAQLNDVKLPKKEYWLDWSPQSTATLSDAQMAAIRELDAAAAIVEADCPA